MVKVKNQRGVSRRAMLLAGAGIGAFAQGWSASPGAIAQDNPGTPGPHQAAGDSVILALPPGVALASGDDVSSSQPSPGGALKLVRPGTNVSDFNPAAFGQDMQIPLSYLESLVRPDPRTLRPIPWLGRGWEWRDSGLTLAISIRERVTWHDGSPLTANDAAFSFQVYQHDIDSAVAGLFGLVDTVQVVSARELIVRFRERDASWLFNSASLPIFSHEQYGEFWDAMPSSERSLSGFDWTTTLPIGTGPWQVADWDNSQVRFRRNQAYWQEPSWFDSLEIRVEGGSRTRLDAWVSGDSHIAWPVHVSDFAAIADAKGVLRPEPAAAVMFAAFNFANPLQPAGSLWTDPQVRRAASLAIDRERYAAEVFGGYVRWDAVGAIAQPWANDPSLRTEPFDPATASALLAAAGWFDYDGDGVLEDINGWPLRPVAILREDSRPELASVLARVARDLAGVGIGLAVEALSAAAFAERWITRRDYDLIAYAYDQLPGFTDFDLYGSAWDIRSNAAGWNPGGYANPDADAAIDEYLDAISIIRQAIALRRLQRAVNDDLFALWFGFPHDLVLVADEVAGYRPDMAWQTARTRELWQAIDPSSP